MCVTCTKTRASTSARSTNTATHLSAHINFCNTLQHIASHCNTPEHAHQLLRARHQEAKTPPLPAPFQTRKGVQRHSKEARLLALSQCVAVCCSVFQRVAVCCNALQCVAVCCSMLQCVAVCCSVLQCVAVCCIVNLERRAKAYK